MAVTPGTGVDLLVGVGGTPEGVLAACALRCLGGELIGRLIARDESERRAILDAGFDLDRILTTQDLVSGDNVFFAATGVTDGALLRGVRFESHRIITQSLSMRSRSGTIRLIEGRHDPERSFLVNHERTSRTASMTSRDHAARTGAVGEFRPSISPTSPYTHPFTVDPADLKSEERVRHLNAGHGWQFAEGAYALEQATKPHTLAAGLGDSPAGLAAWIVEKLRSWLPAPADFGERFFDVRGGHEHSEGGHFAAWERPDAFVADLREAVAI